MKFIRDNWMPLFLIVLFLLSETVHLLFSDIPFVDYDGMRLSYSNPVYYLSTQIGMVTFIPCILLFLTTDKSKRSHRALYLGLIILNIKEVVDEVFYMCSSKFDWWDCITLNKGFYGEILFIFLVILFTYAGFEKWGT